MRIGFDIDGVLAAFIPAYERMFVLETGRNTFPPIGPDSVPEWNWPTRYGYTSEETRAVWARINSNSAFWKTLEPTPDFDAFFDWQVWQTPDVEMYFVTSRPGTCPKDQTEQWFLRHLGTVPTVLISDEKGMVCRALKLDYYVDDKLENIEDVAVKSPQTFAYLLDRAYNREREVPRRIQRLTDFLQIVDAHKHAQAAA